MPWETRGARLSLERKPEEMFSKETWYQADFLQPGFRLPFQDKSFDFVICGHTIEDLSDPVPLLREMQRVGNRGVIECPSRLMEQTIGVRGRESCQPGHPHHHWIVESMNGALLLYSKRDSRLVDRSTTLPLTVEEELTRSGQEPEFMRHFWEDRIEFQVYTGDVCLQKARALVTSKNVTLLEWTKDRVYRLGRRMRRRFRRLPPQEDVTWWTNIVATSKPYSRIVLK